MKTFALATALFFVATIASAQIVQPCTDCGVSVWSEPDQTPAKCSADRPCGAEGSKLNAIIPQGWKGAEFKSACSSHDKCYGALGSDRAECDLQLKNDLVASCECSRRNRSRDTDQSYSPRSPSGGLGQGCGHTVARGNNMPRADYVGRASR